MIEVLRRAVYSITIIVLGSGFIGFANPTSAQPYVKQEFPRLGLMLIGGDGHRYHESDYQRQLARFDFVVLNMNPAWARGGVGSTPNEKQAYVLRQIRALNRQIILSNYTLMTDAPDRETEAHGDVWAKVFNEVGPASATGSAQNNDWWARDDQGEIVTAWTGTWVINITDFVTPDANGETYPEWYARRVYEVMFREVPEWDGIYHDVARVKPRKKIDWDRDGVEEDANDWEFQKRYRAAHLRQWQLERRLMPDLLLTGNIGSWGTSVVVDYGEWRIDEYHHALEGGYLEKFMGDSWSLEKNRGWEKMMEAYRVALQHTAEPKLVVLNAGNGDRDGAGFYQFFRYGFASALMEDGYFDFSDSASYSEIYWFDEYDLAGTATTSWLGKAVDPPQRLSWQKGVYRRRFENGMALVNPRGNGTQTVTIEAGYRFIRGNQDPSVNTGQAASTITLRERDGIVLMRASGSDSVKRPKAPRLVE